MKLRVIACLLAVLALSSCEKNTVSKIPFINFIYLDQYRRVNIDTSYLIFGMADGDGDLGQGLSSGKYDLYIRDIRTDSFLGFQFPDIDRTIEDPKKGVTAIDTFIITPPMLTPRDDSFHRANGDSTYFELYIMDRAGDTSNHIITPLIHMVL
jgi:hypothetical protein